MRRGKRLDQRARTLDAQHLQKPQTTSPEAAGSFTAEYVTLLPRFVERIVRTVGRQDNDLVLNAARRLKSKSWLIGALRMNQLCGELELAMALADLDAAAAVAPDMELPFPPPAKGPGDVPELKNRTRRPRKLQDAMAS